MSGGWTPGPWRVDPDFAADVQNADGTLEIATALHSPNMSNWPSELEQHANARLIAAAPELVEALRAIQKTMDGYRSQAKFCDIEALGYFREFDRRIEASGFRALLSKIEGHQS